MTDPADEIVIDSLHEYKGKQLKAIDKTGIDQGNLSEAVKTQFQPLYAFPQGKARRHCRRV